VKGQILHAYSAKPFQAMLDFALKIIQLKK